MRKVLITGATGFLGSAIVSKLAGDYNILAVKRRNSDTWRCLAYEKYLKWIDLDDDFFKEKVIEFAPEMIIHAAWAGVYSKYRADWDSQMSNFELLRIIIDISSNVKVKKIIGLGSLAEYGVIDGVVNEGAVTGPDSPYGVCKVAQQQIISAFCKENNIDWYWFRVFSIFGPKEGHNWFIPSTVLKLLKNIDCDLTLCKQKYDYLFIDDFSKMVMNAVASNKGNSGIYNLSSGNSIMLLDIVKYLKAKLNSTAALNFGAIPYRDNQQMHIVGDNKKFTESFGAINFTDLETALDKTIGYYKNNL